MENCNYFFASEEDIYRYFENNPRESAILNAMHAPWKQRLLDYMTGKKTLPFTYDPFFKLVFNPDRNPERLSGFLSSILGRKVHVMDILPVEHTLHDGNSLVIMDLLVRLDDGSRANVEIQKYGSAFPAQRMSCYSADSLMQEYERAKARMKGTSFDYRNVNKVYTIVLYENSPTEYAVALEKGEYLHHGKICFDTSIEPDMLLEYYIISLDIFKSTDYTKSKSELNGWLLFLTTEDITDVDAVVSTYPWLHEIYKDVANYIRNPKEVLVMWSKTLQELDKGAVNLYWDQLHEQIKEQEAALKKNEAALEQSNAALEQSNAALEQSNAALEQKDAEIARLKAQLSEYEKHNQ